MERADGAGADARRDPLPALQPACLSDAPGAVERGPVLVVRRRLERRVNDRHGPCCWQAARGGKNHRAGRYVRRTPCGAQCRRQQGRLLVRAPGRELGAMQIGARRLQLRARVLFAEVTWLKKKKKRISIARRGWKTSRR